MADTDQQATTTSIGNESQAVKPDVVEDGSESVQNQPTMSGALPDTKESATTEQGDGVKDGDSGTVKDVTRVDEEHQGANGDQDHVKTSVERRQSGRGRNHHGSERKLIKSNYDNLPETDDPEEIRRQVEFYFSDANLPMDDYLLRSTKGADNKPFPLKELHTFKRMKRFQPFSAVLAAVKDSKVLIVDEDGGVSRKEALSEDYTPDTKLNRRIHSEKAIARTIRAKGFGEETETTQTEIEEFFGPFGEVSAVRLNRHHPSKAFTGEATIEFADEATAKQFLAFENKPLWKDEQTLEFIPQREWVESRKNDGHDRPKRPYDKDGDRFGKKRRYDNDRDSRGKYGRNDRDNGRGFGGKGRSDRRDRKDRRDRDRDHDDDDGDQDQDDWKKRRERDNERRSGGRDNRRSKRGKGDDKEDVEQASKEDVKASGGAEVDDGEDAIAALAKSGESKKRSREEDGASEQNADGAAQPEAKKAKAEPAEVAAEA